MTQSIMPAVWCDRNAAEVARYYVEAFRDATVVEELPGVVEIHGYRILLIDGGDEHSVNPSISGLLNFDPAAFGGEQEAVRYLDELYERLSGGGVLMPLQEYPFSRRYAWVRDDLGFTWQLMLTDPDGDPRPFLTPSFMFGGIADGWAEPATNEWLRLFDGSERGNLVRYEAGAPVAEGSVMFTDFRLKDQWFAAMDAGDFHDFTFTPGVSMMVLCRDQAEIDRYWEVLSTVPGAEACGWCVDRWGVSWQVVPHDIAVLMADEVTRDTILRMRRIDLAELQDERPEGMR
ncbi:MAG: VOC family protein [Arachnia propionica]|uniref:VOC family protein n=1 Tax=Arachnia propionica TaxID=1750 RepID=UPI0026F948CA|nr:VOC family protein [Arachnia propionica]